MTQLLISVKNVAEALIALDAGADIIDLKDPNIGALGALDEALSLQIVQTISGRKPVSATVGEQHASLYSLICSIEARAKLGVDIIKIAVSSLFYEAYFLAEITKLSQAEIKMVAVFFADETLDLSLIVRLQTAGFYGAMLDTSLKHSDLLAARTKIELQNFVALCENHHLKSGLAGSLKPQYIDDLAKINPTYIGFRGGVCENALRNATLSPIKVLEAANMLRAHNKVSEKRQKSLYIALHS
jgi:(5-formylfuran-3-yl)methyl phosphate synthase